MDAVQFQDGGRTFTCQAGSSPATPGTLWWWVTISGEAQRYAAFRTQPEDTPASLQPRVLAYYAQLLADRERPRAIHPSWGQRRAAAKAEPASTPDKV
jgi:hypothetical protein